ncbi:hypothetical protein [Amycolatopsis sp. YIM 10]
MACPWCNASAGPHSRWPEPSR